MLLNMDFKLTLGDKLIDWLWSRQPLPPGGTGRFFMQKWDEFPRVPRGSVLPVSLHMCAA